MHHFSKNLSLAKIQIIIAPLIGFNSLFLYFLAEYF